jgi:hypothetical protein
VVRDARRAHDAAGADDLAWLLVVDSLIFAAEAEIRWLDHSEARLARAAHGGERRYWPRQRRGRARGRGWRGSAGPRARGGGA